MSGRRVPRLDAFDEERSVPLRASAGPAATPTAHPVSEVVARVNALLGSDTQLVDVWVQGEISGLSRASSGHWYFDLKDDRSLLRACMFRGANQRCRFDVADGMEVIARGRVQVYPARSSLQVVVEEIRPVGLGELALRFEALRRRLAEEGLFDAARKRPMPAHPRCIGIVTSLQAAALRDMLRVARTRHPGIHVVVAATRVQGEGAAEEIAAAIERLDASGRCEVIIVGRGGGSIEDLWAFNEEAVVRAVVASATPIVSAVGHETDVTLCDHAADVRAATPSNACELVVPDAADLHVRLGESDTRIRGALARLVPELRQRSDELLGRGEAALRRRLEREQSLLGAHASRLETLSPLSTLARGYAVARRDGRVLRSAREAAEGDAIEVLLPDGSLDATVTRIRQEEHE